MVLPIPNHTEPIPNHTKKCIKMHKNPKNA
jgi:hypothetical protein